MPTFAAQPIAGENPGAPTFITRTRVTLATPADDYVAGGYAITAAQQGVVGRTILKTTIESFTTATGAWDGRHWKRNATTGNLQGFVSSTGAEVAGGVNLAAITLDVTTWSY